MVRVPSNTMGSPVIKHTSLYSNDVFPVLPAGDASFVSAVPSLAYTRKTPVTRTIINVAVINAIPF